MSGHFCYLLCFSVSLLTVWTGTSTLALPLLLLLLTSPLPRRPLPYLLEVPCLLDQWLATLHLRHLCRELRWLHLLHLLLVLPCQRVPSTPQLARCPPLLPLRLQWSVTPAVICSLLYAWVRGTLCVCVFEHIQVSLKNINIWIEFLTIKAEEAS